MCNRIFPGNLPRQVVSLILLVRRDTQTQRVVIVGGSAAGFYAARKLAGAGLRVSVYEGSAGIDPAPRVLIVTDKFRDQMGEFAPEAIVNEVRTFELFASGDRASVQLQRPDLIIERSDVIKVLAEQARQAGAEIVTGHRLVGLEPADEGTGANGSSAIRLSFASDICNDISADVVIGADGAFSAVARLAGWQQQPTVRLVQAIVELPEDMAPDTSRVWFVPEDTPYFYWLIPERRGRACLGIIGDERPGGKNPRAALEGFLERHGLEALEFQGGRIPLYVKWIPVHRKMGRGDVYLMGDAAGQVKVTTVGGIVTGFRGAQGVVDALLHPQGKSGGGNVKGNGNGAGTAIRLSTVSLQTDNGATNGEILSLRRELDLHLWIRRAMHEFDSDDYSKLLLLLSESATSQLGRFHRDETWRLMRNLLFRKPQLGFFGLRNLLRKSTFGSKFR